MSQLTTLHGPVEGIDLNRGWYLRQVPAAGWSPATASRGLPPPPFAGVTAASMVSMLRRRHPDWSDGAIQATMANLRVGPDGTVEPRLAREHHARILRSLWEDRPRDRYERIGVPVLLAPAGDQLVRRAQWSTTRPDCFRGRPSGGTPGRTTMCTRSTRRRSRADLLALA